MKKKSPRGIPDFSRQPPPSKGGARPDGSPSPKSANRSAPPPRAKPQATSSKSGQRGQ